MRILWSVAVSLLLALPTPTLAFTVEMDTQGFEWMTMRGHGLYVKKMSRRQVVLNARMLEEIRLLGYESL
jgi:hypothetical protein